MQEDQSHSQPGEDVTIWDVAEAAQVSISTVSRVINNRPDVAASTRARVLKVIKELNFKPHIQVTSNVPTGNVIALHFPLDDPIAFGIRANGGLFRPEVDYIRGTDFILGVSKAAEQTGYGLRLITTNVSKEDLANLYLQERVDGVILMDVLQTDWRVDFLRENSYQFVMIGRCADNTGLSFVDLDNEACISTAFDYLVNLGHERIGFLTFLRDLLDIGFTPGIDAVRGFEKSLNKHNLDAYIWHIAPTMQDAFATTQQLIEDGLGLTAIVTNFCLAASGIIKALAQKKIRVPDDFSIVGQGSETIAQAITPALTTLDFPAYTMGFQAAQILIQRLGNENASVMQHLFPAKLTIRSSSGVAKQRD